MDRSHRGGTKLAKPSSESSVPAASRLSVRARKNRRRPGSLWSRMPKPRVIADACGRAVRRSVPALAATAAISVIGTSVWLGYHFVTTSERFAITSIEVHGTSHLTADEVRAAMPAHVGDNVFATNLGTVANALRQTPWIAAAEAHRVLPHTLVVEIREHVATAVVELGELYLVDASGHPFKRADVASNEGAGLPILTGIDRVAYSVDPVGTAALVTGALDALATWRADPTRPAIGEVHLDPHHALTLHTYDSAVAIQLGALGPELPARMQTFDAAWAELTDAERATARAIHLDARIDHVTVAFAKD
jgi:cell division septal protein FtsQ